MSPAILDRSSRRRLGRDQEIARIASAQHGVVALDQLRALGLGRTAVNERVRAGRLHPVHLGVYSVGHSVLDHRGRLMAAVLACGKGSLISHRSAAELWGLCDGRSEPIDVTAPHRRGRSPRTIRAHRDGSINPSDRSRVDGIPCTSVARTLLDLAAIVSERQLRRAVASAEFLRVLNREEVEALIRRSRGRRGVARLREAVATSDPRTARTRRELESIFLDMCRRTELPLPEVNSPVKADGVMHEADFLWRDAGLIVETDGRQAHMTETAFEADRRRDQRLKLAGWEVVRFTWRQVTSEPERVARTVRLLLARQAAGALPTTGR